MFPKIKNEQKKLCLSSLIWIPHYLLCFETTILSIMPLLCCLLNLCVRLCCFNIVKVFLSVCTNCLHFFNAICWKFSP